MTPSKPIPTPSEDSKPFWEATRNGELRLQSCLDCGSYRFPPGVLCPECSSTSSEWVPVSGRGRVHSFVVFHRAYHPAFANDLPYAVACVELEEGPRLLSNIVGVETARIRCDMAVEVLFEKINEEISLPKFRPRA